LQSAEPYLYLVQPGCILRQPVDFDGQRPLPNFPLNRKLSGYTNSPPRLDDFEKSPIRFEYEVLIEEYRVLRSELNQHLSNQQQINSYALALMTGLVAIAQLLGSNDGYQTFLSSFRPIILLLSILFSSFALMYVRHAMMIAYIGGYTTNVIRPKIERILTQTTGNDLQVLEWDEIQVQQRYFRFSYALIEYVLSVAQYSITIIPSITLIIIFWFSKPSHERFTSLEIILFALSTLALVSVLISLFFAGRLYARGLPFADGQDEEN